MVAGMANRHFGKVADVWKHLPLVEILAAARAPRGRHRQRGRCLLALTGQQFQSADNEPYYVLFEDFTHVKFYAARCMTPASSKGPRSTVSSTSMAGSRSAS
jgi:hypothetical protein